MPVAHDERERGLARREANRARQVHQRRETRASPSSLRPVVVIMTVASLSSSRVSTYTPRDGPDGRNVSDGE